MTEPADLVLSGRIATFAGSAGYGWTDGLAIRDGRVAAHGWSEAEALAGPGTTAWRLPPHLLAMPSFTDAHLHLTAAALAVGQPDLSGLDRAGVVAAIAQAHEARLVAGDPDGWLLGHGWALADLGQHPSADWLDEAAPGRPVALWSHDHHSRWLSARAIQLAGLAAQHDPRAGRIERDGDGRPTGVFYEAAAGLVDASIPPPTMDQVDWAIGAYARMLVALGVTSVHDPGGVTPDPELHGGPVHYRAMARAGRLPLRVVASVREEQLAQAIEIDFRSGRGEPDDERGRYRDGWLKLFADGALGSRTAALASPYETSDPAGRPPGGPRGMPLRTREELAELASEAAAAGIASQVHAIGDAAVCTVLDVLGDVAPVAGAVHRVEHAQLVAPVDVPRFGQLGIAASVQPCHLLSDAQPMREAWGARTEHAFPLAGLVAGGALIPFGTDAPVEPPDPWWGLAAAVSRRGPGWGAGDRLAAGQAIDLQRALRAAALDGPRCARIDDEGHLGIGARADLLVVPAELVSVGDDADVIAMTRPLLTLLDGIVTYQDAAFDP